MSTQSPASNKPTDARASAVVGHGSDFLRISPKTQGQEQGQGVEPGPLTVGKVLPAQKGIKVKVKGVGKDQSLVLGGQDMVEDNLAFESQETQYDLETVSQDPPRLGRTHRRPHSKRSVAHRRCSAAERL